LERGSGGEVKAGEVKQTILAAKTAWYYNIASFPVLA
jgi:hypothetical protein